MLALTACGDGSAGIGKTTLAKVLCNDAAVQNHFADGVQWLVFGRERSGQEVLAMLAATLGVAASSKSISARLAGRQVLIVLDDIWYAEQVDAFASITTGSDGLLVMLLTTRNNQLADSFGERLQLEQMSDTASLRLLACCMGRGGTAALKANADDTDMLLQACCGNAAMLRSVAGLCSKKGVRGTVRFLGDCRAKQRLAVTGDASEDTYGTLYGAIEGTLSQLGGGLSQRAAELGVFPEDTAVPLAVVAQLWGSSSHEVEAEAATLVGLQLIDVDKKTRALSMIDLHRDYLRCRGRTELAALNAKLLRGCGRSAVGVNIGDEETDRYWGDGRRWVLHLCEGGAPSLDAVRGTVVDAKLTAIGMKPEEGSVMARLVAGCTRLTALDVGFNLFDEEVALAIVRAARRRDQMVSLGLASCKIGTAGAVEIADYVRSSAALASLALEFNHMETEGGVALASALASSPALTSLSVGENFFDASEVAAAIAPALALNSSLTSLNLNELERAGEARGGMAGFVAIAHALASQRSLASLVLSSNHLDAAAGRALAHALSTNQALTCLNVRFNQLGSEGGCAIASALEVNTTLTALDVSWNDLGAEGGTAMATALKRNTKLKVCDLRSNGLGKAEKQSVVGRAGLEILL